MDWVIVGAPESRRIALFQAALAGLGLPPARVLSYLDLLSGRAALTSVVRPGALLRIESPDRDFRVEQALLAAGADAAEEEACPRISRGAALALPFERGRILYPRQWYLGFCRALEEIERQREPCPPHGLVNATAEIAVMFDKPRCHERLREAGVPVPLALGCPESFAELWDRMQTAGCPRVFVKLAHGSSASGVVAYQTDGRRHQATTTVEVVRQEGELRLYNSRRMRVYRELPEIQVLIDALCRHRVHVERWLPKAGWDGRTFDLRVVGVGGRARHAVARLSKSPMTNLHLLNDRADPAPIRERMGRFWIGAMRACEVAIACFPGSLSVGLDLRIAPDFRRHHLLEVNAFGDLLSGTLWEGQDTYTAAILAACERHRVEAA
jgi:hypothetical protein